MPFQISAADFERSPFTGMTWQHWVDAGIYLLEGVFRQLPSAAHSLVFPRHETAVTYPQPDHPEWKKRSENFEAVARTLLIAAPLLKHFPDLQVAGVDLAGYYRREIDKLVTPESAQYIGNSAAVEAVSGDNPYQMTCECASLAIALRSAGNVLWDPLDQPARDRIATVFQDWGTRHTHPHNWRLFNILILAFLENHGYPVDQTIYRDHLRVIRSFDAGDGWYRDGTMFDFYSVWAFQFYAPLWAHDSGYHRFPEMASAIENSARQLMRTYERLFDRNGRMLMWGRSNIYRFAACAPLGSAFLLNQPGIDPGSARRVMSGNLLQFIQHPDFLVDGVPSLGFYGPFQPMIQTYSCAASPFWFGNGYHAVALGPKHPLWTATEQEGSWTAVPDTGVLETELKGPGMVVSQYGSSGASEIRTGKVMLRRDHPWIVDYSRLAFHTDLPWQDDTAEGLSAMHYSLWSGSQRKSPNVMLYSGLRDAVLYRRLIFDFEHPFGHCPAIDLADFILPEGMLRCDCLRVPEKDCHIALSHYALPIVDSHFKVAERTPAAGVQALVASSGQRQLALVTAHGWSELRQQKTSGLHPDARESLLLSAHSEQKTRYGDEPLRIALLLHRNHPTPWTDAELWPFADLQILPVGPSGSAPEVNFTLRDGTRRTIDYSQTEGNLLV